MSRALADLLTSTGDVKDDALDGVDKPMIDGLEVDAATVNDKTVAISVPSDALFTDNDTTYDKAAIDAMNINAATVNGKTVATNVPTGALFTDNNTTYPAATNAQITTGTDTVQRTITPAQAKLAAETHGPAGVQSDWDQTDNTQTDYIKNQPTLGTAAAKDAGSANGELILGSDARLSDSRTCDNTFDNAVTAKTALALNNVDNKSASTLSTEIRGAIVDGDLPSTIARDSEVATAVSDHSGADDAHAISKITGLQTALNEKVDDSQVLTNVPSGAVFTDTTYSVGDDGLTQKNFTTTLKTKLDAVESGATADQTDTEIRTLVASASDSNVFTNDFAQKLDNIEGNANNYAHPNHLGDVSSSGDGTTTIGNNKVTLAKMADIATDSFLGRDTAGTGDPEVLSASTVRTILNVEDGATADQTNSEIETAYNSQVSQVSTPEKTAGTETGIRRFAVSDIKGMIDTHETDTTYSIGDGGLTQKNFTTTLKDKLDDIDISALPTLSKSNNVLTISNYSSYTDPIVSVAGAGFKPSYTQVGAALTFSGISLLDRVVGVSVAENNKLARTVTQDMLGPFRYFRISGLTQVGSTSTMLNYFHFFTGSGQSGTRHPSNMTSATAPSPLRAEANYYHTSYPGYLTFASGLSTGWWTLGSTASEISNAVLWLDLGEARSIASVEWQWYSGYYSSTIKLEGSNTSPFDSGSGFSGEQTLIFTKTGQTDGTVYTEG